MIKCARIPVLDIDVYFVTSLEDARAFIRDHSTVEDEEKAVEGCRGCCYTVTDAQGRNHRMMCVFENDIGIVAHEATHMAWRSITHSNIKISTTNHEILALLVEWLVNEFLKILRPTL